MWLWLHCHDLKVLRNRCAIICLTLLLNLIRCCDVEKSEVTFIPYIRDGVTLGEGYTPAVSSANTPLLIHIAPPPEDGLHQHVVKHSRGSTSQHALCSSCRLFFRLLLQCLYVAG